MGGKDFFKGLKLSKKELTVLIFSLILIYLSAFFISAAIVKKKNEDVAAANISQQLSNKEQKALVSVKEAEDREEIVVNKKFVWEERKQKAQKEARRAAELARIQEQERASGGKVVYLTFDDGPSVAVTPRILDTLKKYDVKATFFVIGSLAQENSFLVKRAVSEGHVIANHTYSHNMDKRDGNNIYSSTNAFIEDLTKGEQAIKAVIGEYDSKLIRFPGGSYSRTEFQKAVVEYGYHYVDWNVDSQDTKQVVVPEERIVNVVMESCAGKNHVVILMHDAPVKTTTADALPRIIEYLKEQGYTFKTLQ